MGAHGEHTSPVTAFEPPDRPPLDPDRITASGHLVEVVQEAGSTNALVAERGRAGAPEGTGIVAEHQTAGRGRLERVWETPPRSALTFSVLLRPTVPAASWPWLPLLIGCSVAHVLRGAGHDAGLKWPNDVLLGERKVAGILVERIETDRGAAAVVGVGLNVGMTRAELPVAEATSLFVGSGAEPDRTDLLVALLDTLWEEYVGWQTGGEPARRRLAASYAGLCVTLGRAVRVDLPAGRQLAGRATEIDTDGRLVVETAERPVAVGAGDVVHVRDG